MITPDDLTLSEKKTRKVLYGIIGRKISESRKSSRRKLEGISNKLNINVDILKKIESGDIEEIEKEIPITGFIRAFAKFTKTDISEEIEKLQSDYVIQEKPKSIYNQVPSIKTSKILVVFLLSFGFLLVILYVLSLSEKKNDNILSKNHSFQRHEDFVSEDFVKNYKRKEEDKGKLDQSRIKLEKDDSFFEILFLEETWIEIYSSDNSLVKSGLYNIGDSLNFVFEDPKSDFFIKSGNLGGFQIFFKDEFFAPFGYSGEVNKGFYVKEKISKLKNMRL